MSDELGVLATPIAVINRSSRAEDLARLKTLVERYHPQEVVIGLPVLPSGDLGPQAANSQRLASLVSDELGIPVRFWNESYSTIEAQRRRLGEGRRRKRLGAIDAEAAAVFLQDYLDANR